MTTKGDEMKQLTDEVRDAMRTAFNLGQTYWRQADSESVKQQNKSITREDVIRMAKESGFKACVGTTDKEGNYHPFVNALGKDIPIEWIERFAALAALDTAQPALSGCACRWGAEDNRIATCTRHQGWLDVVQEWAARAKVAVPPSQAQPPAPSDTAITYMTGYSDGREWAGATNQAQPSQAVELDYEKKLDIVSNWFSDEGMQSRAMQMLGDIEQAIAAAPQPKETK